MSKWFKITTIDNIPIMGSRVVQYQDTEIAIFKTKDESIFAINNICPHKQGKLSEGLVHEHIVTCPLHNWEISLKEGKALGENSSCTNVYETKIEDGFIFLNIKS